MIETRFEIKIALLGNVSAGKTTVLNALFREKYGEVSMKRTTAGVNYFRISAPPKTKDTNESKDSAKKKTTDDAVPWSATADDPRSADSILAEITLDNLKLRESADVQEKWFDIELEEELLEMREKTKLVFVDIPGINEAGTLNKYKDYVDDKWDSFDCVVVVMDGKQGVNTEDSVCLLNLAQKNCAEKKNVPIIILFNKVDDPNDKELVMLAQEARETIKKIFGKPAPVSPFQDALPEVKGSPNLAFGKGGNGNPSSKFAFGASSGGSSSPRFALGMSFDEDSCPESEFGASGVRAFRKTARVKRVHVRSNSKSNRSKLRPLSASTPGPEHTADPALASPTVESSSKPGFGFSLPSLVPGFVTSSTPASAPFVFGAGPVTTDLEDGLFFIPISAMHAFIHQSASRMSIEAFSRFFDRELIDKIGRDQIGRRRFNVLSDEERIEETFAVITDPEVHIDALSESNFDKFMTALADCVGGSAKQEKLIEHQMESILKSINPETDSTKPDEVMIATKLHFVYQQFQTLRGTQEASTHFVKKLKTAFVEAYSVLESNSLRQLGALGPDGVNQVARPIEELLCFFKFFNDIGVDECEFVHCEMKAFVRSFISNLLAQAATRHCDMTNWKISLKHDEDTSAWTTLSPVDWSNIFESILLLSYDRRFCEEFGREKIMLERVSRQADAIWSTKATQFGQCPLCKGVLVALDSRDFSIACHSCQKVFVYGKDTGSSCVPEGYGVIRRPNQSNVAWLKANWKTVPTRDLTKVRIPESLADPDHFGHVVFKYCEFKRELEQTR